MGKRRRNEQKPGYGKLLDSWTAPADAGEPVGCLATTFTFSSEFFEEQCLSRFARVETDRDEDGPFYLLEMEEKLAQLACAAVLVDQHHCRGSRSPRWDMLGVRPADGLLHAKISLLHWNTRIRLIIASANLTEDGYRRNREVFGVIDYSNGGEAPLECLQETVSFLHELLSHVEGGSSGTPAVHRCKRFLDSVLAAAGTWDLAPARRDQVVVKAVLSGPGRPPVSQSLASNWPGPARPEAADVVSPFFDPPEVDNRPARQLWSLLRQRGDAAARYHVVAEDVRDADSVLVHAPRSLRDAQPQGRSGVRTEVHRLTDDPARPLHAKAIWLANDTWSAYLIGSSNFTSPGFGLGPIRNFEANLLYLVNAQRSAAAYHALCDAFPESDPIPAEKVRWQPIPSADEEGEASVVVLPSQFSAAIFAMREDGRPLVRLKFAGAPPGGWRLYVNETDELFLNEEKWLSEGGTEQCEVPWPREKPAPYGFTVHWDGSPGGAWLPVNIESNSVLPPPTELRDLPLEVLIDVLTSGQPLHKAMRTWLNRKRRSGQQDIPGFAVDPHKRVNTSAFLLQRTRRVSWALRALRQRLEQPLATREMLMWRLYGPVGVEALANALVKEAKSDEERCFLLTELALELARVKVATSGPTITAAEARKEIALTGEKIMAQVQVNSIGARTNLGDYIRSVLDEIRGAT